MAETCEPSEYFISDDIDIKGNVIVEQTLTGEIMPSSKYNIIWQEKWIQVNLTKIKNHYKHILKI